MTWTTANMQRVLASRGWLPDGDPVRTPAYKKNYYTGEIATLNESVTEKRLKRPVSVYIYAADQETSISSFRWPSMLSFLEAVVAGVYMTPHAPNDEMIAPDPPRQPEEGAEPAMGASHSFFGLERAIQPPTPADALSWEAFCRNESGPTYMVPVPADDAALALEIGTNYTVLGYGEGVVHSRNRAYRHLTIRFDRHDEYVVYPLSGSASAGELFHYRDGHRVQIDVSGRARWGRVMGGGPRRLPDRAGYEVRVLLDREPWREPDAAPAVVEYITDESHNGMRPRVGQQWMAGVGAGTIQSITWQPQRNRWAVTVAVDTSQQRPASSQLTLRGGWEPITYTRPTPPAFIEAARQQLDASIAASQRAMAASLYGHSTLPAGAYTVGYSGGSLSGQLSGHQHAVISRDEVPPAAAPSLSIPEQVVAAAHEQAERLRRAFHNPMAGVVPGRRRRNP